VRKHIDALFKRSKTLTEASEKATTEESGEHRSWDSHGGRVESMREGTAPNDGKLHQTHFSVATPTVMSRWSTRPRTLRLLSNASESVHTARRSVMIRDSTVWDLSGAYGEEIHDEMTFADSNSNEK